MARLVNLTPHAVAIYDGETCIARWERPPTHLHWPEVLTDGGVLSADHGDIPIRSVAYLDAIEDPPPRLPGVVYVVSRIVAEKLPRDDFYFPCEEKRVDGRIVGCYSLGQFRRDGADDAQ